MTDKEANHIEEKIADLLLMNIQKNIGGDIRENIAIYREFLECVSLRKSIFAQQLQNQKDS
jgi:hypothetical protein